MRQLSPIFLLHFCGPLTFHECCVLSCYLLSHADPFCFMSNAIGVGAITLTSDEFLVFVLRADWTGEYAGCLDRPGGHPEPSLVIEVSNFNPFIHCRRIRVLRPHRKQTKSSMSESLEQTRMTGTRPCRSPPDGLPSA